MKVGQPQSAVGPVAAEQRPADQIGEGGVGSLDPLLSADPWARGPGSEHWAWEERPWTAWSWPSRQWGSWSWHEPQPWWSHRWGQPTSWYETEWSGGHGGWAGDGRVPGDGSSWLSPPPHRHVPGLHVGEHAGDVGRDQGGDLPPPVTSASDESWFSYITR